MSAFNYTICEWNGEFTIPLFSYRPHLIKRTFVLDESEANFYCTNVFECRIRVYAYNILIKVYNILKGCDN